MARFVDRDYSSEELYNTFITCMLRVIKSSGITRGRIAEVLGVSRQTIYSWLDGSLKRIRISSMMSVLYTVRRLTENDNDMDERVREVVFEYISMAEDALDKERGLI